MEILLIILISSFALPSEGRIGYDIRATVGSTSWEIHRSTQELVFSLNGSSTGTGKFSKYARTQKFGGMNSAESSYALSGTVYYKEMLLLKTLEGPVSVKTNFEDIETESSNETKINLSAGNVEIQEQWPTYLADYKQIRYLGPGIRTKEVYENNGDVVTTSISSWKLNRESLFKAYINKTVISVDLNASNAIENRFFNKSSSYALGLQTTGDHASLEVVKNRYFLESERFGRPETYNQIYQEYVGSLNATFKLRMDESIILDTPDYLWLPCCVGGYVNMSESDRRYRGADEIFNCSSGSSFKQSESLANDDLEGIPWMPLL